MGGQGIILVDDHEVAYSTIGRQPNNDLKADSTYRNHYFPIYQIGRRITLKTWDITNIGEIVIDNVMIGIDLPLGNPVFSENFEDESYETGISVETQGAFNNVPGIKQTSLLGGVRAFGFGQSDCPTGCYRENQSTLRIFFPKGVDLLTLKFKAIELISNWGSQGELYINGQLWPAIDFARQPSNDFTADTSPRSYHCFLGIRVYEIKWTVWDITDNSEVYIDDIELFISETGAVEAQERQPEQFSVLQNYPNPFNASTDITFSLIQPAAVQMTIFNAQGQIVEKRDLGKKMAGLHKVAWDGAHFSSGNYFCRMETPQGAKTLKLILIR